MVSFTLTAWSLKLTVKIFQFSALLDNPGLHDILHATAERLLQPRPGRVLRGQQSAPERQPPSLRQVHAGEEQDPGAGLHEGAGEEVRLCEFSGQWRAGPAQHEAQLQILRHSRGQLSR